MTRTRPAWEGAWPRTSRRRSEISASPSRGGTGSEAELTQTVPRHLKKGSTRTPRAALRVPWHPQSLRPAEMRSKAPGARYRRGTASAPARPRPRRHRARGDRSGDRSAAAPRWQRWPQAPQGVCPQSSSNSPGKQQRSSRQPPDAPRQRSAKLAEPRRWFRSRVT